MPPKQQSEASPSNKQKLLEDNTDPKKTDAKEKKEEKVREKEMNELLKMNESFKVAITQPGFSSRISCGIVVGRVVYREYGHEIDCAKMGLGGKGIPPNIDRVGDMRSDALVILFVEKYAAFFRLVKDEFYNRYPCIIITPQGRLDVATKLFLWKMKLELNLPVLALVDSDPYGFNNLLFYGCGSETLVDIKWLGIRPSDLDKAKIPEQCRLPMSKHDIKTSEGMLEDDFVKKNPGWVHELQLMVKTKQTVDTEALSFHGFQYLSEVYLPLKLQERDWL